MTEKRKFIMLCILLIASLGLLYYVTHSTGSTFVPFRP